MKIMRKRFFILACVLLTAAIGFIIFALGHPELSFPWNIQITHIFYGLYVDVVILLFVLAFWKKADRAYILAVILELGAVFFWYSPCSPFFLTVNPIGIYHWHWD